MKVFSQHRGFSILMALGITAILMIVVTGLAVMYMKELKISRLSYDEVLAQTSAEGVFEYGMLKIRNHADGFQDSMFLKKDGSGDVDAKMFALKTERSKGLEVGYEMMTQTDKYEGQLEKDKFLVLPLWVGEAEDFSPASPNSKKPDNNNDIISISGLKVSGLDNNVSWTISATKVHPDGTTENIGLQGQGNIDVDTLGDLQLWDVEYFCVDSTGKWKKCDKSWYDSISNGDKKQEIIYSYTLRDSVENFLKMNQVGSTFGRSLVGVHDDGSLRVEAAKDDQKEQNVRYENFYLILYNRGTDDKDIVIESKVPNEKLPYLQYWIQATAQKGDASQIFKFSEDKSGVYDVLKYGYYETN